MTRWESKDYPIESESDIQELIEELRKQLSTDGVRTDVTVFTSIGDTGE